MLYLYYYRSVSGVRVPGTFAGNIATLRSAFAGSVTPIVSVVPMKDKTDVVFHVHELTKMLDETPHTQTGLRFSIQNAINALNNTK